MLRPRKITFFKMMLAGYLSATAFRALKPKKQFSELQYSDCFEYDSDVCDELVCLFEDDDLISNIACLESIEDSVNLEHDKMMQIWTLCSRDLQAYELSVIKGIGVEIFLTNFVFCTKEIFAAQVHATGNALSSLNRARKEFSTIYKRYVETGVLPECVENRHVIKAYTDEIEEESFIVSEPFGDYNISSGKGFNLNNSFVIDDDALAVSNGIYKKFVLYLYSLDSLEFEKFQDFLFMATSNCSVRLYNAVKAVGYRNFLINYLFADDIKFFQIRNFGRKSLFEFNQIKPQIIDFVINECNRSNIDAVDEQIEKEKEEKMLEALTLREKIGDTQYSLLTNQLKSIMTEVSVRTQNGINNYKGDFIEDFVHKSNDVRSLRHIGKKSKKELEYIIGKLRDTIGTFTERELTPEEVFWMEKSSVYGNMLDEYCHSFYQEYGRLPMLHILENCIVSLVSNRSINILNSVVPLIDGDVHKDLEEVAKEHNLSRERIRQICVKSIRLLSEKQNIEDSNIPSYHMLLSQQEDWLYIHDALQGQSLWNTEEIRQLVSNENSKLNIELIIIALTALYPDEYSIIGKVPLTITSRSNGWSNSYIIAKRIVDSFDFDAIFELVHDYEETHTESSTFTIQELLMDTFFSAWKEYDFSIETELEQIVGKILIDELELIPDLALNYTLEGKKEEDPADILYNLLNNAGDPLSIDELFEQICVTLPNKYKSSNSLRAIITRDPRLCLLGVNNMVALSEWEHVKTGSIRELIVAYLTEFDSPLHIKDIVSHILTLRKTSERSISATMASGDQFVKYAGGYYGLADRTYSEFFSLSEAERYSRKRIIDFEEFIKENLRFPFCPSNDNEEESLYQWWGRVKRNKEVSDFLKQEIERIESTYSNLARNKSDYQWLNYCIRYRDFVHANGRQPSDRNPIESDLAKWFSKALNDVADGRLSSLREKEFVKLCKSL